MLPKTPYLELIKRFAPLALIAVLSLLLFLSNAHGNSVEAQLTAAQTQVETITTDRNNLRTTIAQRDQILSRQSASILALETAAKANRAVYEAGLKQAQVVSASHVKAAVELMALQAPDGELNQCRAARQLLEDELTR